MLSDKKRVYNIILEKKVKEELEKISKEQDRSLSNLINHVLKKWIEENKGIQEY